MFALRPAKVHWRKNLEVPPHSEEISAALHDIELGPTVEVYPVADALRFRRIPYAFVSSRPPDQIAPEHSDRPLVAKPFEPAAIEMVLKTLAPRG